MQDPNDRDGNTKAPSGDEVKTPPPMSEGESTGRRYDKVQLIAYHIYTSKPFETGYENKDEPSKDIEWRFSRLLKAMEYCRDNLPNGVDQSATTLKIFVAPEFYGRAFEGKLWGEGHYQLSDVWKAFTKFKGQCEKDEKFRDWLIVPGTFVAIENIQDNIKFFNAVFAFTGEGKQSRFIRKKYFANVDKLPLTPAFRGKKKDIPSGLLSNSTQHQSSPIQTGNVSVGIDICMDYVNHRLKSYLASKNGFTGPDSDLMLQVEKGVEVHVMPACGLLLSTKSGRGLAARQGGYAFHVDGWDPRQKIGSSESSADATTDVPMMECQAIKWFTQTMLAGEFGMLEKEPLAKNVFPDRHLQVARAARSTETEDEQEETITQNASKPVASYGIFPAVDITQPLQSKQ